MLIEEQLKADHIEPANSPWNSPIFVIPKKSGKWRLLPDLHAINEVATYRPPSAGAALPLSDSLRLAYNCY